MRIRRFLTLGTLVLLAAGLTSDLHARGFGGFRGGGGFGGFRGGGGFGGGGFGGGGLGGGGFGGGLRGGGFGGGLGGAGFRGGDFAGGGFGANRFGGGDFGGNRFAGGQLGPNRFSGGFSGDRLGGEGFGAGGFRGGELGGEGFRGGEGSLGRAGGFGEEGAGIGRGEFGATPDRTQLNSFLGLPSDEGLHTLSRPMGDNFDVNRGAVQGPLGGFAAGATVEGPRGNTVGRGIAVGPEGGVVAGRGVEGARGGIAGQGVAVGPEGRVAAGAAVRGPGGYGVARGVAAGPYGAAAGFARVTPAGRYATGAAVRNHFNDWGIYGDGWYTAHPGAWFAAGWRAGSAWTTANWSLIDSWLGYSDSVQPVSYDYGTNVTYENNNVYVNGEDAVPATQYYQESAALAETGAEAKVGTEGDWLPLGVFALAKSGHDHSNVVIQLALNKQAIIRGNYTDTFLDQATPLQGSVDKKTQRAAFTVGAKTTVVFETGLYNLTKDEAPVLIQFSKDRTEQWLLIRLKQPENQPDPQPGETTN